MRPAVGWWNSRLWGHVASVVLLPYAILKTFWALGLTIGISAHGLADVHAAMESSGGPILGLLYRYGIDFTTLLALVASLLALALVRPWGQRVPRVLLLVPALLGGAGLACAGTAGIVLLLGIAGAPADTAGIDPWVFVFVYGGFLAWGIAICGAAASFLPKTRERPQ